MILIRSILAAAVVAAVYLLTSRNRPQAPRAVPPVLDAFRQHRSGLEVEAAGRVERVLSDDRKGTPHERFIVRIADSVTVLVAHNLDLAPRVPLAPGDSVELRGEYEWSERGGTIHWTHDDPAGRHETGWIHQIPLNAKSEGHRATNLY